MHMNGKFFLLAPALLLAACAQRIAEGTPPAAQASAPPPVEPIKLTLGGYYSPGADFAAPERR
jgi:hypothetical protein